MQEKKKKKKKKKKHPDARVRLGHGNTVTAAVIIKTLPPGYVKAVFTNAVGPPPTSAGPFLSTFAAVALKWCSHTDLMSIYLIVD